MKIETFSAGAPFIIRQDYAAYTGEQHAVWVELVGRVLPKLEEHAAQEYLDGLQLIDLKEDCLPNLKSISAGLSPRTGWNSTPVSGFLPAPAFSEMHLCAASRRPPGYAAENRSSTRPSRTSFTMSSA